MLLRHRKFFPNKPNFTLLVDFFQYFMLSRQWKSTKHLQYVQWLWSVNVTLFRHWLCFDCALCCFDSDLPCLESDVPIFWVSSSQLSNQPFPFFQLVLLIFRSRPPYFFQVIPSHFSKLALLIFRVSFSHFFYGVTPSHFFQSLLPFLGG